jgi:hypothetical protein
MKKRLPYQNGGETGMSELRERIEDILEHFRECCGNTNVNIAVDQILAAVCEARGHKREKIWEKNIAEKGYHIIGEKGPPAFAFTIR